MKILVVEDDYASRSYLEIILKKEGYNFKSSDNGKDALEIFKEYLPDVVLSDINMSQMNGIELLGAIKKIKPETIMIMLTAYTSEEYVMQCIRLGANNYLKKPIPKHSILSLLRKHNVIISDIKSEKKVSSFLKKNNFKLQFKTDFNRIHAVVNYLVNETENLFSEETKLDLKLGLSELVLNAVEHGNLGITFSEKNEAVQSDSLVELYEERMANPEFANKIVEINFSVFEFGGQWIIKDQGNGFIPESVPSPISEDGVLRLHGRGIFICKFQFDEVEYIGNGNTVRVMKRFIKN